MTAEVDKAAARLGFARADEVQALRDEVARLRSSQLERGRMARTRDNPASAKKASERRRHPPKKAAATMTPTKKATATKSAGRKPPRKAATTAESASQPGEK